MSNSLSVVIFVEEIGDIVDNLVDGVSEKQLV